MKLYNDITPSIGKSLEKTAMLTKLSEKVEDWSSEVVNEAYNQLPFLSGKELEVDLQNYIAIFSPNGLTT